MIVSIKINNTVNCPASIFVLVTTSVIDLWSGEDFLVDILVGNVLFMDKLYTNF